MRRRGLLATAATTLPATITGCNTISDPGTTTERSQYRAGHLALQPITTAELPTKVLHTIYTGGSDNEKVDLFLRTLNGPATTTAFDPPLPGHEHYAYDGMVFELSYEIVDETPATSYWVHLATVTTSVAETAAVQFADLPTVDQQKFREQDLADGDQIGVLTTFVYTRAEREESVLVPYFEKSYIRWANGAKARWDVNDTTDKTLETYEYTATQVASATEYGREMRDRFVFNLTDVPEPQRRILEAARTSNGYNIDADSSQAGGFESIVDRFREKEQVHGLDEESEPGLSGQYLVRFQNDLYWTWLKVRPNPLQKTSNA